MNRWIIISAWVTLAAFLLPCTHGLQHHHEVSAPTAQCESMQPDCCACDEAPCPETNPVAPVFSGVNWAPPVRQARLVPLFQASRLRFEPPAIPAGEIHHLRTVQLLI